MRRSSLPNKKMTLPVDQTSGFVHRFCSDAVLSCERKEITVIAGVAAEIFDVVFSEQRQDGEEVALLRYLPFEDGKPYLSLVFIPEYNNRAAEVSRCVHLHFQPEFFESLGETLFESQPFKTDRTAEQVFTHDAFSREALDIVCKADKKETHTFPGRVRLMEAALQLVRHAVGAFYVPDEANYLPACSFLNNTSERSKILEAQKIVINRLDNPLTIRELSREVGMNECYLKKGFKAMFGKSIHEYLQHQRIEKAKILLQQKNMTVNEVAMELGFGSPSHFSTAFKKIAGMKPCELLQ